MRTLNKLVTAFLLITANSVSATQTYNFEPGNQEQIESGYFINSQFGNLSVSPERSTVLKNDAFVTLTSKEASNSSPVSLSAWVKFNNIDHLSPIVTSNSLSGEAKLALEIKEGYLVFSHLNNDGTGHVIRTEQKIEVNTWTHTAAVSEYGIVELFINGQSVNLVTLSNDILLDKGHTDPFVIGGNLKTGDIISGEIDDVNIEETAFSLSQLDCQFNRCNESLSVLTQPNEQIALWRDLEKYRGDTGPQGNPGVRGVRGNKGDPGRVGIIGKTGKRGVTGPRGMTGTPGSTGPKGYPGRCIPMY